MQRRPPRKRTLSFEMMLCDLLMEVCVEWGFCIPPADRARIASSRHLTADQFATEVLLAEGFDADVKYKDKSHWYRRIRQRFIERFGEASSAEGGRFSSP